jgi:dTDP-glucose pyrophosphorylase
MKYPQYTLGLVTGFCLASLYFMAPAILESFKQPEPKQPDAPKSNFEVVDTYSYENRTCSVIRYTTPSTTWVYLLDCKEVKK